MSYCENYLPQILQQSLDLLLCTKVLSSWTIHEGRMSTLTIRFKDVGHQLEGGALLENNSATYKLTNRSESKKARDSKRVTQHKIHNTRSSSQLHHSNTVEIPRNEGLINYCGPYFTSELSPQATEFSPCVPVAMSPGTSPLCQAGSPDMHTASGPLPLIPGEMLPEPASPEIPGEPVLIDDHVLPDVLESDDEIHSVASTHTQPPCHTDDEIKKSSSHTQPPCHIDRFNYCLIGSYDDAESSNVCSNYEAPTIKTWGRPLTESEPENDTDQDDTFNSLDSHDILSYYQSLRNIKSENGAACDDSSCDNCDFNLPSHNDHAKCHNCGQDKNIAFLLADKKTAKFFAFCSIDCKMKWFQRD